VTDLKTNKNLTKRSGLCYYPPLAAPGPAAREERKMMKKIKKQTPPKPKLSYARQRAALSPLRVNNNQGSREARNLANLENQTTFSLEKF